MNLRILPGQQGSDKHRGIFTSSRIEPGHATCGYGSRVAATQVQRYGAR
jgi:hypothetical protein